MAFFDGRAIGKIWRHIQDAVTPPSNPEGDLNLLLVDAAHLSGTHALEHFTAKEEKVQRALTLLAQDKPEKTLKFIFRMAEEIESFKLFYAKMKTNTLNRDNSLRLALWDSYGQIALDTLDRIEQNPSKQAATTQSAFSTIYAGVLSIMPEGKRIDFLMDKKDRIGPMMAQQNGPVALSPFFHLFFFLPKDEPKTALLDAYAPYLETYFATNTENLNEKGALLDTAFIATAKKAYDSEEKPAPSYLEEARRRIVLGSTNTIFNAASRGGDTYEQVDNALTHMRLAGLSDADPVIWTDKEDARLYRVDTLTIDDESNQVWVLCQHTPKATKPLLLSRSGIELTLSFELALSQMKCPVGISSYDVEQMADELNLRRTDEGQWPGYPAEVK
ncbi:MAG: hypothetical protein WC043_01440 [Pseudobdellovibrionaceae bacterium]